MSVDAPAPAPQDAPTSVPAAEGAALGKQLGATLVQIRQDNLAVDMLEQAGEAIATFPALATFSSSNAFFQPMIAALLVSTLRTPCTVSKALADLTAEDGDQIGGDLAVVLVSNLQSAEAVEEWVVKHAALQQLDKEPWFRPAMNALAQELLKSSSFGAKFRL
jgi:hypothetical protein